MTRSAKSRREVEVFTAFARKSGLPIDIRTIESRDPPEPDIFCRLTDGTPLSFELTELIDRNHMERMAMVFNTKRALEEHFRMALTHEEQTEFTELYRHGMLNFDFAEGTTLAQRKAAMVPAFRILLGIRKSVSEFTIKHDTELMPVLTRVYAKKVSINGPLFDVSGYGWLGDPTEDSIRKKLGKPYTTATDLELLAYVEWDLLPPSGAWIAGADLAAAALPSSQFRRIWVYNAGTDTIDYVNPQP